MSNPKLHTRAQRTAALPRAKPRVEFDLTCRHWPPLKLKARDGRLRHMGAAISLLCAAFVRFCEFPFCCRPLGYGVAVLMRRYFSSGLHAKGFKVLKQYVSIRPPVLESRTPRSPPSTGGSWICMDTPSTSATLW